MIRTCLSIAALASSFGCASSPPLTKPAARCQRNFTLASTKPILELRLHRASLTVADGSGDTALCSVQASVCAGSDAQAQQGAATMSLLVEPSGDTEVVQLLHPNAALDDVHAVVTLQAPAGVTVRVIGRHLDVDLRGCRGQVELDSETLELRAEPADGALLATAQRGTLQLGGRCRSADVALRAGTLRADLSHATPTHLQVRSEDAEVTVDLPDATPAEFDIRVVAARLRADEVDVQWQEQGRDTGDGWRHFRGRRGHGAPGLQVDIASVRGTVALRGSAPRRTVVPAGDR